MITAIDTNILLDIVIPNPQFCGNSVAALESAATDGLLVICDLVYAELCMHYHRQSDCDEFLYSLGIRVEGLTKEAHFLASRAARTYRKQGGSRTRLLADFLIGAHAQAQASCLISRDRGFYISFPKLKLIDPSA